MNNIETSENDLLDISSTRMYDRFPNVMIKQPEFDIGKSVGERWTSSVVYFGSYTFNDIPGHKSNYFTKRKREIFHDIIIDEMDD